MISLFSSVLTPKLYAGDFVPDDSRLPAPIVEGNVNAAGPGLVYSAAMGPLLLVGVHGLCWT